MRRLIIISLALTLLATSAPNAGAATITIVNSDSPGEGFNDNTVVAPVGGNPGTTRGQQRLNVFQHAADIWGAILESPVVIKVEARFNPQTCSSGSAVLGSAAPIDVFRSFANAPFFNTWYHAALADKLSGSNRSTTNNDIVATFNSALDNNCFSGGVWYYGLDGNEGGNIELLPVVLHELGHGLGFSSVVSLASGAELLSADDIYERHLYDLDTQEAWNTMSNAERAASATNTGRVVWTGAAVTEVAPNVLDGPPIMQIHTPAILAQTLDVGSAAFGPSLTETPLNGDVVLVDDGDASGGTSTSDGCQPLINAGAIAGNIALVDRGDCTFVLKAQAAEAAGAIAVILVDNIGGPTPPSMGGSGAVGIPMVSVTLADGNAIKAQLGAGVNVTLQLDPTRKAGIEDGMVRLYAPPNLAAGSSINHWDTAATPSLLMEPFITGGLSGDIDLTRQHFADIGWFPEATATPELATGRSSLKPNMPNPFNPATTISFELARAGDVQLEIYDVAGRHVRTLATGHHGDGPHSIRWDGTDETGQSVSSGVYVYRLRTADTDESRRMVLLK